MKDEKIYLLLILSGKNRPFTKQFNLCIQKNPFLTELCWNEIMNASIVEHNARALNSKLFHSQKSAFIHEMEPSPFTQCSF